VFTVTKKKENQEEIMVTPGNRFQGHVGSSAGTGGNSGFIYLFALRILMCDMICIFL
jgi:hypothetical protein